MRVVRADHLGMCFGVRRAIALALEAAAAGPLTVLGELVHNENVLEQLEARGIRFCHEIDEVGTSRVAITAHGVSERRRAAMRARGWTILDATCPLVRAAYRAVTTLARDGYHPVLVGARDHVEVRGLTEDLADFDVVSADEDVARLEPRARIGLAAQTTQRIERVREVAALLRRRFPASEVRVAETVCRPTRLRQEAAARLAGACDVIIVVGGARSNNTRELCTSCRRSCDRVFHVRGALDLRPEWLDGARVIGLTAGTSTPDEVIDRVEARLRDIAQRQVAA